MKKLLLLAVIGLAFNPAIAGAGEAGPIEDGVYDTQRSDICAGQVIHTEEGNILWEHVSLRSKRCDDAGTMFELEPQANGSYQTGVRQRGGEFIYVKFVAVASGIFKASLYTYVDKQWTETRTALYKKLP